MLNQTVLVGRLTEEPKAEEDKTIIVLSVPRAYKNENGEFDVDNIPCTLSNTMATQMVEYCHKGDLVGIKGHIQMIDDDITIIAERVTFLSSNKKED